MPSDELKDDWEVAQQLIFAAINEIYSEKEQKTNIYRPWGGIFNKRSSE